MRYTPHLFIAIGGTGAMWTLRETYLHEKWLGDYYHREVRSSYVCTLSNDPDKAFEKAKAQALKVGLELKTTRDELDLETRDIKRAGKEEMEARREAERQERLAREHARQEAHEERMALLDEGVMPYGKHRDRPLAKIDPGYLQWMVDNIDELDDGTPMHLIAQRIRDDYAHLLPKPAVGGYVGEAGERIELDVEVDKTRMIHVEPKFYGAPSTLQLTLMRDREGHRIVVMSSAFRPDVHTHLRIRGTVKKHESYNGEDQTTLSRVMVREQYEGPMEPDCAMPDEATGQDVDRRADEYANP